MPETPEQNSVTPEKAAAPEKSTRKKAKEEAWLIVSGPANGRRRAGHSFGAEVTELRAADLTDDQIAAIKGDPQLAVAIELRPEAPAADL